MKVHVGENISTICCYLVVNSPTVMNLISRTGTQFRKLQCSSINSMPKKSSSGGGTSGGKDKTQSVNVENKSPISQTKDGNFSIAIQVKAGAKINAITDINEESVSVQISAPPVDGEANLAIVKYFSEVLNVKKADVSLKGGKSRQKTVTIDKSTGLTNEQILQLLKNHEKN